MKKKRYLVTIRLVTYKTGQTAICMCSRLCIRRVLLTYTRVWRYVDAVVRYLFTSVWFVMDTLYLTKPEFVAIFLLYMAV